LKRGKHRVKNYGKASGVFAEIFLHIGDKLEEMPDVMLTDEQRRQLCELLRRAFIDIGNEDAGVGRDLADALHNLPNWLYKAEGWSVESQRAALSYFRKRHPSATNYLAMFNEVFPDQNSQ
jgi:hypothetical protein